MVERIVKVVCFALVASFCGLVGGTALYFLNYDISADLKAQRVRQAITQLKDLGPRVEEFRRSHNRLPTDSEVFCDLRPCGRDGLLTVRPCAGSRRKFHADPFLAGRHVHASSEHEYDLALARRQDRSRWLGPGLALASALLCDRAGRRHRDPVALAVADRAAARQAVAAQARRAVAWQACRHCIVGAAVARARPAYTSSSARAGPPSSSSTTS